MEDPAGTTSIPTQTLWSSVNSWFTSTVLFILLNVMIATILFTSNLPTNNHHQNQQEDNQNEQEEEEHDDHEHKPPTISPSILHRLKTFNFRQLSPENDTNHNNDYTNYNDHYQETIELAATQYVFNETVHYQHFDEDSGQTDIFRRNSGAGEFYENETPDTLLDFEQTHEEIRSYNGPEDEFQTLDDVCSKLKVAGHVDRSQVPVVKVRKSVSLPRQHDDEEEEVEMVEARRPETMRVRKRVPEYDDVANGDEDDDDVEVDSRADDFINKFKKDLLLQRNESIMKKGMKN